MTVVLQATGFFVLRAPLLPLDELDRLRADGLYWRRLAARPHVREALHLASPELMRRLSAPDPDGRVVAATIAYLVRMCSRATPFGLFAGCSVGAIGQKTVLAVDGPDGTARRSRPDTEVLTLLVQRLLADSSTRPKMLVQPNSSLYGAAGAMRLVESRVGQAGRTHHLVMIGDDPPLRCALDAARYGCTVDRVAELVCATTGASRQDAYAYAESLVDAQVLTPVAEPAVTGSEPLAHVLTTMKSQAMEDVSAALQRVADELTRLDAAGLGNAPDDYSAVVTGLLELAGDEGDEARLIQVDLHRRGSGATLGADVVRLLADAVDVLHRVCIREEDPALRRFKREFRERYDEREVPLMEALDEEMGIGFDRSSHPAADESALLAGIDLGGAPPDAAFTARDATLLDLLIRVRDAGAESLELDGDAVARLGTANPFPLPDALAVFATLLDDGGAEIHDVTGPSGAELLGRFCHGDQRMHEAVRAHLRAEEAQSPGVVFAEIVHLPEGRVGNVLARPVLRDYEVVVLGRSGAATERQLSVDELTIRLDGDRLVLFSPRLGSEVRPRLSTAHNPAWRGIGVYRFLAALRGDGLAGRAGSLKWDWGALATAPSLPRVTAGRLVLQRARWRLSAAELDIVSRADAAIAGWKHLIRQRGLPTEFFITDHDNRLFVDTASSALTAAAAKVLRGRSDAVVEEVLDSRVAAGPDGRFAHELVVPFVRRGAPDAAATPWRAPRIRRTFPPGSEWLYVKVYTGTATADRVLTDVLAPVIDELASVEAVDQWFFLRYADPDHHLRLRLHGDPHVLTNQVLPALTGTLAPQLDDGSLWRITFDTYEREVERYGGDAGIELAEQFHAADSEAVVAVLGMLDEDDSVGRWQLCLYAIDRLLGDAGLDIQQRREWARIGAAGYRQEYPAAPNLDASIGKRWRAERAEVSTLLDDSRDHVYGPARMVFRHRSDKIAPLLGELSKRFERGQLTQSVPELLRSFAHLHAVRLLRSAARTHELVVLGFLDRYYTGQLARTRQNPGSPS